MNAEADWPFPFHLSAINDLMKWLQGINKINLVASRHLLDEVGQQVKIRTDRKGLVRKFQSPRWARICDEIRAPVRDAVNEIPIEGDYPPPRIKYYDKINDIEDQMSPVIESINIIDDFSDEMIHPNLTSNFRDFVNLLEHHRALFGIVEDSPPEIARRIIDAGAMPCGWVGKFPEGHFEAFAREVVD